LSAGNNLFRRPRDPDLTNLRGLPRAEAMRIAMIRYGWDAATAAKKVDIEREEPANLFEPLNGAQNTQRAPFAARSKVTEKRV
jgi:hypothetical protein